MSYRLFGTFVVGLVAKLMYNLKIEDKEILKEWARQISEITGFENLAEKQLLI